LRQSLLTKRRRQRHHRGITGTGNASLVEGLERLSFHEAVDLTSSSLMAITISLVQFAGFDDSAFKTGCLMPIDHLHNHYW